MEVIKTEHLSKSFGETVAADRISIHVKKGEIYGFLGLNGAGKTTLIRMLLGMIKPNHGNIFLFGKPLLPDFKHWNDVGYLVETPLSYPELSVYQNLKVYYHLRGLNNPSLIDEIIEKLKLSSYKNKKAGVLSMGNQQRLGLAKALMHKPKLLILDEPINGLDPEGIVETRKLLKSLAQEGTSILLSSHILGEISKIANRIGIVHQGKLIRELNSSQLQDQLIKKVLVSTNDNIEALKYLKAANFEGTINEEYEIEIFNNEAVLNPETIAKFLCNAGLPPRKILVYTEDLEMYFLRNVRN